MWHLHFVVLFCISLTLLVKENNANVKSSYRDSIIIYPTGISNERHLLHCLDNMACNLVHNRFWFLPLVIKLCQCADKSECPYEWSEKDEHTMFINPRAQLKFCSPVTNLPECLEKKVALTTRFERSPELERHLVEVKCYCPKFRYFDTIDYNVTSTGTTTIIMQTYACQKLEDCHTGHFCGHITSERYETYYVCTCPQYHYCLIGQDRNKYKIREALYDGNAYRGVCVPW